jgi:Protein of unknown function (DUF3017)
MLTRGLRWMWTEFPFVVVVALVIASAGYLVFFPGHWRRGTGVIAVALLTAGVLRCVLPPPRVGMLGVRGRWRDTVCYLALGGVILAVAIRLH